MERAEAVAIYDQGREAIVAVLLRMDEQITRLGKRVAQGGGVSSERLRLLKTQGVLPAGTYAAARLSFGAQPLLPPCWDVYE